MENKEQTIGIRLQILRNIKNLKPKDIKALTGISPGNLHSMENDKTSPSAQALIKLAKLYNVSIDWILTGETSTEQNRNGNPEFTLYVPDLELMQYCSKIVSLWEKSDEPTRSWIIVQLRRAFPEIAEQLGKGKKK